ncbi:MAG TPA: ABC transporter ATP-binding protein [Terracidiphilus sp.]|nr:ABC transporter ATP-binding protein [Terracidiphilus sp.]
MTNSSAVTQSATARSGSTAIALRVVSLSKHYGQIVALEGVSLEVRAGECVGLLGPNGAGKSTLIRSIVGRVVPDSGSLEVFGHAAGSAGARMSLGWIPQEIALYPRITVRENLTCFGRYFSLPRAKLNESVAWCLKWAALEDRAGEISKNLSGGMKRRLNMAAGLVHRPRIVLMDEPTVGVDPQSRIRIFEMIESLRSEGSAIVYTTHYMEEAERLCDRIAIIDHGKIIAHGTNESLVRDAFGQRSQVTARFSGPAAAIAAWTQSRGGRLVDSTAEFTIEHSSQVGPLLESAATAGLVLEDVTIRQPNLESVFLHLTGRELRD